MKHGHSRRGKRTRLHRIWLNMRSRCNNPKSTGYKSYGGRGIRICDEWNDFTVFKDWAEAHGYSDDLTIERVENNGNYEPGNCIWIPNVENVRKSWTARKKECRGGVKLSVETVSKFKQMVLDGVPEVDARRVCGISETLGLSIAKGLTWADTGPSLARKPAPAIKIPYEDIPEIKRRVLCGETRASVAKSYGVDPSTISVICSGKSRVRKRKESL